MEPSNNPRATPSLRTATFPFSCISIDGPRRFFLQIIVNILRTVVVARPPLCRRETQPENWEAESDRWRFLMVEFLVIFNSARIFFSFFFFNSAIPSTFGFIPVIFPILFLLFDFIVVDYGFSVLSEE